MTSRAGSVSGCEPDTSEHKEGARPRGGAAWILGTTLALLASAVAALVILDLDLSPQRYLRNDVLFRGADSIEEFHRYSTMDPSPFSVALPTNLFVHRSLRAGELPFWDRHQGGGYSPWVQGNLGVAFPLRWLAALLPERQAHSALILATLSASFALCFLLLLQLRLTTAAALFGAGSFAFSSFMLSHLPFDGVAVYLFIPWLLLAYLRWRERQSWGRFGHLTLAFGLSFTSGHHMLLAASFLAVGIAVAADFALGRRDWRVLLGFAASAAWGAGLAAAVLLPFAIDLGSAWTYKTESHHGLSYVVPDWQGWLAQLGAMLSPPHGPFLDSPAFYLHLGTITLLLALVGAWAAWRRRELRFVPFTLAATFLVCLPGPWMGILGSLPPLTWVRVMYLYAGFVLGVCVAAALGFDRLQRSERLSALPRGVFVAAALALLCLPLLRGLRVLEPVAAAGIPESEPYAFLRSDPEQFRITGLWGQNHLPNISNVTGLEDLRLIAVALNPRYHAWFEVVDPKVLDKGYPTSRVTNELGSPLVGAFNVKYVVQGKLPHHLFLTQLTADDPFGLYHPEASPLAGAGFVPAYEDRIVRIARVDAAYRGRVFFPERVAPVEPGIEGASAWLRANTRQLPSTVVAEVSSPQLRARLAGQPLDGDVRWSLDYPSGHAVHIRASARAPALLVLNDLWAAGWRAELDGEPVEILPVNLISRGIYLPAGEHEITMGYRPPGLTAGMAISGLALLALAGGLVLGGRRSIAAPDEPIEGEVLPHSTHDANRRAA
ncbi:MAG: YfhO family protein [Deltaproteobacteria bacterium]|nr:YfhO family protein [Deltaproteobacteria bacterium]